MRVQLKDDGRQIPVNAAEILQPARCAFLVWDMQIGIASKAVNLQGVTRAVRDLATAARDVDTPVFWSQHVNPPTRYSSDSYLWTLMRRQGVANVAELRPVMQRGTDEVQFLAETTPDASDGIIEKTTQSFFIGTPLESRLRALRVQTVVLSGVATEQGVEFTARHALALGFLVVVAKDAVSSYTKEGHELGMRYLESSTVVLSAADIATLWRSGPRSA